jgi:hypothetical protein
MLEWPRGAVHIVRFLQSNALVRSNYAAQELAIQARAVTRRRRRGFPRWSIQRAGIVFPHAEGDELRRVTGDDGLVGVTSVPA